MNNKNICKFVLPSVSDSLRTMNFILESNTSIMSKKQHLRFNRLILVINGSGIFHFDSMSVEAEMGSIVVGFNNETFYAEPSDDMEYMYIDFDGGRCAKIFNRFGIDSDNRHFKGYYGIVPIWEERLASASEITIDLVTEGILLYTFSKLVSEAQKNDSIVGQMIKITKENFVDPNLSIVFLAEELSYNPKYLSHTFKKTMGINYSEYLKNMRIKYAISLFENGIDSVKNVALLSGFSDPLYFSTVFTKSVGTPPSKYKTQKETDN